MENGFQKINGLSSMGFCWWQVLENGDESMGKRVSEDQWIIFDGLLSVASIEEWRWKQGKMGFRRSMDYLRWAFVGGKYRRMAMEARENGLQKINELSSMGFCWWQVLENGDESMGKRVSEDQWIIFNGLLEGASIEEWRWKHGGTGFRRSNG